MLTLRHLEAKKNNPGCFTMGRITLGNTLITPREKDRFSSLMRVSGHTSCLESCEGVCSFNYSLLIL